MLYLCNLCSNYCSGKPRWKNAWPCVFFQFSILSDDTIPSDSLLKLCFLLPVEICKQWRNAASYFPGHVQAVLDAPFIVKGKGTVDGTKSLQLFQELTLQEEVKI